MKDAPLYTRGFTEDRAAAAVRPARPGRTGAVEASHGVDEARDGGAAARARLEGWQVGPAIWHEMKVFGFVHQVSGGNRKHSAGQTTSVPR